MGSEPDSCQVYPKYSEQGSWVTDSAWITGVVGVLSLLGIAYVFNRINALEEGIQLGAFQLTTTCLDTKLTALLLTAFIMVVAEFFRLWLREKHDLFVLHPFIREKKYFAFFKEALSNYLLHLILLIGIVIFYHTAGEYRACKRNPEYYRAWFRLLDFFWQSYLIGGFPYVVVTRAFKYSPFADKRDYSSLIRKLLMFVRARIQRSTFDGFTQFDKKNALSIVVKVFFAPLMTVFFVGQFGHLVKNIGYVKDVLPGLIALDAYSIHLFNTDVFHIGRSFIFTIDVAIAWCGYIVASRWVDNQTASAEPTTLGWLVCLICYSPFQKPLSMYYGHPSGRLILEQPEQWLVAVFVVLMTLSFLVYMSATIVFGVRFSNLTNRGIIRKGPYAIVRHPAYASKNFSWWCVMFPFIVLSLLHSGNWQRAMVHTAGLIILTWVYYLRAITEERHLSQDPAYAVYCKQVKYRFIPGVI